MAGKLCQLSDFLMQGVIDSDGYVLQVCQASDYNKEPFRCKAYSFARKSEYFSGTGYEVKINIKILKRLAYSLNIIWLEYSVGKIKNQFYV